MGTSRPLCATPGTRPHYLPAHTEGGDLWLDGGAARQGRAGVQFESSPNGFATGQASLPDPAAAAGRPGPNSGLAAFKLRSNGFRRLASGRRERGLGRGGGCHRVGGRGTGRAIAANTAADRARSEPCIYMYIRIIVCIVCIYVYTYHVMYVYMYIRIIVCMYICMYVLKERLYFPCAKMGSL